MYIQLIENFSNFRNLQLNPSGFFLRIQVDACT